MKPKLRFKEFSKGWEKKKLKDIAYYKKGFAFKSKDYKPDGVKIIRVSDLGTSSIKNSNKVCIDLNEKGKYLEWELKENDLIITTVGSKPPVYESLVGKVIVVSKEFDGSLLNQNAIRVRVNKGYCQTFLPYIFDNKKYICFIEAIIRGNANQGNITVNDLFDYSFKIPSLPEQTKIADFLSTVDEKIQNQQDKITHLENIKKGFMQKIFSRKIRFKDDDGNDFPEWEEKKLGHRVEEYNFKTIKQNQYPILSSTKSGIYLQSEYFNKQTASENTLGYKIVPKGYFTYRSMSDTGEFTFNIQNIINNGIVSPAYPVFKADKDNSIFLQLLLNNSNFIKKQLLVLKEGGTRYALSFEKFCKLKVFIPCLEEQQKIADFLSSFGEKIDVEKDTLEHLKEMKKGLLQQMFV